MLKVVNHRANVSEFDRKVAKYILVANDPGIGQQRVDFFATLKQMLKLGPHLGIHGYGLSLNSRRVLLIRLALPSWLACLSA